MKRFLSVSLALLNIVLTSLAQNQPSFITDSLDQYVERALKQWQIPGAAILVVKDGKVVIEKGYGVRECTHNEKVDANTLFMIGSNTKAFTATALSMLEFEGKLKLEDKVIKYLPDFKMKDPWVTKELNLVDIMTHRMGMETFQGDFMNWASDLTSDEVVEKFGRLTPMFDFRTKYGYTNAGYVIAGKIIEKVTGKTWANYLKEKIFLPLQMNRTLTLSEEYFSEENIAKPHTFIDGKMSVIPFQNIDNLAPCGSIVSSIKDLSHWIIAQLDSGRFADEDVIPIKALQRTRIPETIQGRVTLPFNKGHFDLYGLGWGIMDYEATEIVSHTGGVNGFLSSVTLLPEKNIGIVILTNTDQNSLILTLKSEIIDAYLGLPYRSYDNFIFNKTEEDKKEKDQLVSAWRDSVSLNFAPQFKLSRFWGRYENEVYGFADLIQKENYLELSLQHHSKLKGKLEYMGNNRFLCTYSDPTYGTKIFPFELDNSLVKSFELYVADFIEPFGYKFIKK